MNQIEIDLKNQGCEDAGIVNTLQQPIIKGTEKISIMPIQGCYSKGQQQQLIDIIARQLAVPRKFFK